MYCARNETVNLYVEILLFLHIGNLGVKLRQRRERSGKIESPAAINDEKARHKTEKQLLSHLFLTM